MARLLAKIGADLDYLADPNGAWDDRTAVWAIHEPEALGVGAVEQPSERTDLAGMADLGTRATRIRLLADESVCRPADAIAVTPRGLRRCRGETRPGRWTGFTA